MTQNTIIKSYKFKIKNPVNMDWENLNKLLRATDEFAWRYKNRLSSEYYSFYSKIGDITNLNKAEIKKKVAELNKNHKERAGVTFKATMNHLSKQLFAPDEMLTSDVNTGLLAEVESQFTGDHLINLLTGERVAPTFKSGTTIPFAGRITKQLEFNQFSLSLISPKHKLKDELGIKKNNIEFEVHAKTNSMKSILKKLQDGEYELRSSKIQKDGKNWFFIVTYKQPVTQKAVHEDYILGIDLGVSKAAVLATNHNKFTFAFEGGEIEAFRKRIEKRRVSIRNQLKYCSDNRKGHGRNTLYKPLDSISHKIEDFKNTVNHRYSKKIVDLAVQNGCGTIQMEDLSGVNSNSTFLSNWSYFDLQQKISYKAEQEGIKVKYILPRYTSQRCNKCGVIDKESRVSQEQFECTTCGHKDNADYNAAKNIAMDDIFNVIYDQCLIQGIYKEDKRKKSKKKAS